MTSGSKSEQARGLVILPARFGVELKLIYVAGPFSAPTREGVEHNIKSAVIDGLQIARLGGVPVIPHSMTSDPEFERVQPNEFWIDGTLELMKRCDAVFMGPGWWSSKGARKERVVAGDLGLPIFDTFPQLKEWLNDS
jgi:hypothetical protein